MVMVISSGYSVVKLINNQKKKKKLETLGAKIAQLLGNIYYLEKTFQLSIIAQLQVLTNHCTKTTKIHECTYIVFPTTQLQISLTWVPPLRPITTYENTIPRFTNLL